MPDDRKPAQELLCISKNGIQVTYDPIYSHATTHLQDTPQLKTLVIEVVKNMVLNGQEAATHVDMGRVVGTSDVVTVDDTDEVFYAIRKNRMDDGLVPFTKTRAAEPSRYVAVHLVRLVDGSYELSSAWIGTFDDDSEPFPQSPNATKRSIDYWRQYAFVWGSQEVVPGSVTTARPW